MKFEDFIIFVIKTSKYFKVMLLNEGDLLGGCGDVG
jgi:hypothetical protein